MTVRAELPFENPYDFAAMLGFLSARAIAGIEEVFDGVYRRSLVLPGGPALVEVALVPDAIGVELLLSDQSDRDQALAAIARLFDLGAESRAIDALLAKDPLLEDLVAARPGRRLPGAADAVEIVVRAVLGQQVTVAAGVTLASRLVAQLGEPLAHPSVGVTHSFPAAKELAAIDPDTLAMPSSRKRALVTICAALDDGSLDLAPGVDRLAAREAMVALPGIGPWTAEYVAMRALGDGDAFLATDLGVRRALELLGEDGSPRNALALAERWRPYRAYAQQHLWASLADKAP